MTKKESGIVKKIQAKCPKCGKLHKVWGCYIGNGVFYKYCKLCDHYRKNAVNIETHDYLYD